jgi:NAD(P)H-dependent flavin oxidoreductase YrpB (nitropropane dioxygenase family)
MLPNKWNISSLSGKMFSSIEADTVITHLFTGRPARSIRNRFIEKYVESKTKPLSYYIAMHFNR